MIRRTCLLLLLGIAVAVNHRPTPNLPTARFAERAAVVPVVQTAPATVEPQPTPAAPPKLHAYLVLECKSPTCMKHRHFFAIAEELNAKGWGAVLTVLAANQPAEAEKIEALDMGGDVYPYVVLTVDGDSAAGTNDKTTAKEIGDWLNERAVPYGGWQAPAMETEAAAAKEPVLSAVVVSGIGWCAPCMKLERDADAIKAETGATLKIIDSESAEAREYNARNVPTTIIFRDGKEVARQSGYSGRGPFIAWLRSVKGGRWE